MAKYNFTTGIPYGTEMYEVTGLEYCLWEDIIERAGEDRNAQLWATFDFLVKQGYDLEEPKAKRVEVAPAAEARADGTVSSPSINGVPDGMNLVSGTVREKEWSPSKILAERKKLLTEREQINTLKERALDKKITQQRALDRVSAPYEAPSQINSLGDVVLVAGGMIVLGMIFFVSLLLIIAKLF